MPENFMRIRLPALPDPAIFGDPDRSIMTADGQAILAYDPATRTSFIYAIEQQRWTITAPVDFEVFATLAALSGYSLANGEDAQRWLRACSANTARKTH